MSPQREFLGPKSLLTIISFMRVIGPVLFKALSPAIKKPTKFYLNPAFPSQLDYEIFLFFSFFLPRPPPPPSLKSLFSTTLTSTPKTQCSIEYTSEKVDLECVLFRYSVTCSLSEWPKSKASKTKISSHQALICLKCLPLFSPVRTF